MIGATNNLPFISDSQGKVALPPIIAKVSIAAAGATAVKNEPWMTLDDFLKV
jgi:hypothetical protein